jgi:hypothetical protein
MYVIASAGHCVINGLGQVKVYDSKKDAETMLAQLWLAKPREADSFTVQEVHLIKEGAGA